MSPIKYYERNKCKTFASLIGHRDTVTSCRFLTFLDREVLEAAAPSVPRYQVELDEPRCELLLPVVLVVDRKGEDWERVGLFSTVLQCLVQHLGPRPRAGGADGYLDLLAAPVSMVPIVCVHQLHHVDNLVTAEVKHELCRLSVWSQPVVLMVNLHSTLGQQLLHGEGVLRAAVPGAVILGDHSHWLLVRTL